MVFQKMNEKFHREMKGCFRMFYVIFLFTLLMLVFKFLFDLSVFDVLFQIGKCFCLILGGILVIKVCITCEKVLKQHDELVEMLEKTVSQNSRDKNH